MAAGIAEGFAAAGASTRALVLAGATVVVTGLAREVATALTARDPVAAHADAELDLESIAPARANLLRGGERGPALCARRVGSAARDPLAADA